MGNHALGAQIGIAAQIAYEKRLATETALDILDRLCRGRGGGHTRSVVGSTQRSLHAEDLWFLMHHSADPNRRSFAVTCYLDDSGSDEQSPIAVLGGLLLNQQMFIKLEVAWEAVLAKHKIEPPLHMKEFGRPHGRFASMDDAKRFSLFTDIARIINQHKIYSLAAIVNQKEFFELFSVKTYRKLLGTYGFSFFVCCLLNHRIAVAQNSDPQVSYLLDEGNRYRSHIIDAHAAIAKMQKSSGFLHLGALAFDYDDNNAALQAADVIAWTSRKQTEISGLNHGFEALDAITRNYKTLSRNIPHLACLVPRAWISILADRINDFLRGSKVGSRELSSFIKLPPLQDAIG